jgi:hypothetical protein
VLGITYVLPKPQGRNPFLHAGVNRTQRPEAYCYALLSMPGWDGVAGQWQSVWAKPADTVYLCSSQA